MATYSATIENQARAASSTELSILNPAGSGKALKLVDILIGTAGTTVVASRMSLKRIDGDSDGTGTSVIPANFLLGGDASIAQVKKNHSGAPTYLADDPVLVIAYKDTELIRWVAIRNLEEIILEPGQGVGFVNGAGTTNLSMTVIWEE